jgi:hypothetical protein
MKVILLFLLIFSKSALAMNSQYLTETEYCTQALGSKTQDVVSTPPKPNLFQMYGLIYRYFFARGTFLNPVVYGEAATDVTPQEVAQEETLADESESDDSTSDIAVLSTGVPTYALSRPIDFSEAKKNYIDVYNSLKSMKKHVFKMVRRSKSVPECAERIMHSGVDFKAFQDKALYISNHRQLLNEIHDESIEKRVEKKARHMGAEFVSSVTVDQLQQFLSSTPKSTVALVLHASEDGVLYDSNWNMVPRSIFKELSKSLRNLVVFSCHSSQVAAHYDWNGIVARTPGVRVFAPEVNAHMKWLLKENAPADLFGPFLRRVLKMNPKVSSGVIDVNADHSERKCEAKFELPGLKSGSLGVFINQSFVGMIDGSHLDLNYRCSLLKSQNVITLQNLNLFEMVSVEEGQDHFSGQVQGLGVELKNFFNTSKYVGSKGSLSL